MRPALLPFFLVTACVPEPACGPGTHAVDGVCQLDDTDTGDIGGTGSDTDTGADTDTGSDTDTNADSGDSGTETGDTGEPVEWTVCASGGAAFTDIQPAVDAAGEGDTVYVCPGTYSFVEIERRAVDLVGAGTVDTIIDGGAGHTAVTIRGVDVSIRGFTLRGTSTDGEPAALSIEAATGSIRDVEFSGGGAGAFWAVQRRADYVWENLLFEGGAGGLVANDGGSVTLFHSVFRGLSSGAVSSDEATELEFHNNLIVDSGYGGIVVSVRNGWVYNNTLYSNDAAGGGSASPAISHPAGVVVENNIVAEGYADGLLIEPGFSVNYNVVWGHSRTNFDLRGGATVGTNIEADPKLNDPNKDDFTLDVGFSPCVDAGNALSGYNDVDGSRNDIGMYGGPDGAWTPR